MFRVEPVDPPTVTADQPFEGIVQRVFVVG
jgi:hypothetical protein